MAIDFFQLKSIDNRFMITIFSEIFTLMEALWNFFIGKGKAEKLHRLKLYNYWISRFHLQDGSPVTCTAAKSIFKYDALFLYN